MLKSELQDNLDLAGIEPQDFVVVGVSGGPDSMTLLKLLADLHPKCVVAHVNYQLRGEDSDADEELVRNFAEENDLIFKRKLADLSESDSGVEEQAREIRYQFFEDLKQEHEADFVALGHNSDDQAETVLLNFLRGSFVKGMTGMDTVDFDRGILRPFLNIPKSEIRSWAEKADIAFNVDATNKSLDYTRNYLRHELIPKIEEEINPGFRDEVTETRKFWKELNIFIEQVAEKTFSEAMIESEEESIELKRQPLLAVPDFLKIETIKYAISKLLGDLTGFQRQHYEEILKLIYGKGKGSADLPRDIVMKKEGQRLVFTLN